MKKRVRIYKSQTGEGQFLNKTAQFLRKAQMGGTPSIEDLSYPGQAQAQGQGEAQQPDDNQLASLVMNDISNSRPKEEIVVKLVNIYGKDPLEATNFVNEIYQSLQDQSDAAKEADEEEDEDPDAVKTGAPEDAEAEDVVVDNGEDSDNDGFYGDDSSNDAANQVADEDDEVEDDDTDVASQVVMRRGGYMMRADEGMEIQNQYPITFPGIEAYLPANMSDMLSGEYDVATGQAWQRPQMEAPETSDDAGISYAHMDQGAEAAMAEGNDAEASEGIAPEENFDESEYRRGGAYKKGKKAYVNSVLSLVKKQMGGDQESNNPDDLAKKSDQADPIGAGLRKGILQSYIGTLKNQGQLAVAKEEAEQAYDQMMQQQMMPQSEEYPIEEGSLDEAQFGGFFRRRRMDGFNGGQRGMFGRQPRIPQGFGYGYPPIESMDVRRSGIFGRPKEYSVQFGQMPSVMPGYGMPGVGPGFYGYGYTGTKKSPARKIVEDQAVYVNSQANKDVAAVTPGNDATNKDVKVEEKKTETTTVPGATTAAGTTDPNATTTTTTTTETKTTPTVQNSSNTAKQTQVKKDVKKEQNTAKVSKPQGAKPEAPMAPRQNAPGYIATQNRPDLVRDNTRVQQRVAPVNIPKIDLTKTKSKPVNVNLVMAQAKDPFAFAQATMIKDPKQRAAAMNKIMFPFGFHQEGGMVDNPFSDEYGALQRFVY